MGAEPTVPTFSVKPEVAALEELFEEIKLGRLRSPRFQRAFVWKPEDMRRLFESVVKGYPIGSLLIWEPGVRYECLSRFGPFAQNDPAPDATDLAYVLDGQHRLATLFGVTHVEGPPPLEVASRHWWMWFDLETEEFTHSPRGGVGPAHLPLRELLGTTQFLRFCVRLLPYALQIVLLAQFFCDRRPTSAEALVLRRWLFATSFSGWFAGGNTTQINGDLVEMDRFKRREVQTFAALRERAKPFPERFDLKSARVRVFLLATLVRSGPLRRLGNPIDIVSLFPNDDVASVPKVFPRAAPPIVNAPANRILLPTLGSRGARRQLLDLPDEERAVVLRSHCIDDAAWEALQDDDAARFVKWRTAYLIDVERELMSELDLQPPERETEDAPLDADA